MTHFDTIDVALGKRSYKIIVGTNLMEKSGEIISPYLDAPRVIIITDRNVAKYHLKPLKNSILSKGIKCDDIILEAGEKTKSFKYLQSLIDKLLSKNIERSTTLLALGGGTIGDLVGFTAAILLRGLDVIQVPTTLLAQVDSSVGGKTGINVKHGKNLVGAFYQPKLVLADMDTLDTLPQREIVSGYVEITKYGLISSYEFFEWLEKNGLELCDHNKTYRQQAVIESCRQKSDIVSKDETEKGNRALLNLGHTFGHALEKETGFSNILLHGEAVAMGIILAYKLSSRLGYSSIEELGRVVNHYKQIGLRCNPLELTEIKWSSDLLMSHMGKDKKVQEGKLRFVLPKGIGSSFIADNIPEHTVHKLLNDTFKEKER